MSESRECPNCGNVVSKMEYPLRYRYCPVCMKHFDTQRPSELQTLREQAVKSSAEIARLNKALEQMYNGLPKDLKREMGWEIHEPELQDWLNKRAIAS